MVNSTNDFEMVNCDIEMCAHAYLSEKRDDSFDLLNRSELRTELRICLRHISLVCKSRIKSEFDRVVQISDMIMLFSNLP